MGYGVRLATVLMVYAAYGGEAAGAAEEDDIRMSEDQEMVWDRDVIEAVAAAWASIDGKISQFESEKELPPDTPQSDRGGGYYDGYMVEAEELLKRASLRLAKTGKQLMPGPQVRYQAQP